MAGQWDHRIVGSGARERETADPTRWKAWGSSVLVRASVGPLALSSVQSVRQLCEASYPHPIGWMIGVSLECVSPYFGDTIVWTPRVRVGSGSDAYTREWDALTMGPLAGSYRPSIATWGPVPGEVIAIDGTVSITTGDAPLHDVIVRVGAWTAPEVWP